MREHAITPFVVRSKKQAKKMTAQDPSGRVWNKGDEYYEMYHHASWSYDPIPVPVNHDS